MSRGRRKAPVEYWRISALHQLCYISISYSYVRYISYVYCTDGHLRISPKPALSSNEKNLFANTSAFIQPYHERRIVVSSSEAFTSSRAKRNPSSSTRPGINKRAKAKAKGIITNRYTYASQTAFSTSHPKRCPARHHLSAAKQDVSNQPRMVGGTDLQRA